MSQPALYFYHLKQSYGFDYQYPTRADLTFHCYSVRYVNQATLTYSSPNLQCFSYDEYNMMSVYLEHRNLVENV